MTLQVGAICICLIEQVTQCLHSGRHSLGWLGVLVQKTTCWMCSPLSWLQRVMGSCCWGLSEFWSCKSASCSEVSLCKGSKGREICWPSFLALPCWGWTKWALWADCSAVLTVLAKSLCPTCSFVSPSQTWHCTLTIPCSLYLNAQYLPGRKVSQPTGLRKPACWICTACTSWEKRGALNLNCTTQMQILIPVGKNSPTVHWSSSRPYGTMNCVSSSHYIMRVQSTNTPTNNYCHSRI